MNEENNKSSKSNIAYVLLTVMFFVIVAVFTVLNIYESISGEYNQKYMGLSSLDSIQNDAVSLWGGLQKGLGKNIAYGADEYKDVTRMPNGNYTLADLNRIFEPAVECALEAKDIADQVGADFIYVQSSGKVRDANDLYPGTIDYSYIKRDTMIQTLNEAGIECIDIKKELEECLDNGEASQVNVDDWFDYFYVTDHHWRNSAAFEGYRAICKKLEQLGYDMDEKYMDSDLYSKTTYESIFLGSHGRMAGPDYTGVDDYELWLPTFETDFTFRVPSENIEKTGSFEDCFVYYDNLAAYSYDYYAYYTYLNEDYKLIEITNNQNAKGPKILIIRDSSAVPVSVFLASQASEIDLFDLRYLEYGESIKDYIYDKKPDVIMYMFNTGYLGDYEALRIR